MNTFSRDEILAILKNEMNELTKFNTDNVKRLSEKRDENKFIKYVLDDYKTHYKYILNSKKQQQEQIEYLLFYIENALSQGGITETMLNQARYERSNLLRQLDNIKKSIDEIIETDKHIQI